MAKLTAERIEEIISKELQKFEVDQELKICRYMNLPKFMSLLTNSSIFFTRADKFEDPLEGEMPEAVKKDLFDTTIFKVEWYALLSKLIDREVTLVGAAEETINMYESFKSTTFISCWTAFQAESYALWKIYGEDYGIAIQTNTEKLKNLIKEQGGHVYKVHYVDDTENIRVVPKRPQTNKYTPGKKNYFVCKKIHYSYEQEIRAIIFKEDQENLFVDINLNDFIEAVYISPFAASWYVSLVKEILKKYNLDVPILNSKIKL